MQDKFGVDFVETREGILLTELNDLFEKVGPQLSQANAGLCAKNGQKLLRGLLCGVWLRKVVRVWARVARAPGTCVFPAAALSVRDVRTTAGACTSHTS